jgi:hypothetical protein
MIIATLLNALMLILLCSSILDIQVRLHWTRGDRLDALDPPGNGRWPAATVAGGKCGTILPMGPFVVRRVASGSLAETLLLLHLGGRRRVCSRRGYDGFASHRCIAADAS